MAKQKTAKFDPFHAVCSPLAQQTKRGPSRPNEGPGTSPTWPKSFHLKSRAERDFLNPITSSVWAPSRREDRSPTPRALVLGGPWRVQVRGGDTRTWGSRSRPMGPAPSWLLPRGEPAPPAAPAPASCGNFHDLGGPTGSGDYGLLFLFLKTCSLFLFPSLQLHWKIRQQCTKAWHLLCPNGYKDMNKHKTFPRDDERNQGCETSCVHGRQEPPLPAAPGCVGSAVSGGRGASSTLRRAWKRPCSLCLKSVQEEPYFNGNDFATWRTRFKQNLQQRLHHLFSGVFIHWNVLRRLPSIRRKETGLM